MPTNDRIWPKKPMRHGRTWTHTKGGFYHDGRFATLPDVINHYNAHLKLDLTEKEVSDLTEYLKSL
jgi:hypothetical protein